MRSRSILIWGFILIFSSSFYSQSSFGGYPTAIKWNQINTPIVRVIFPDSLEERAQRVANIIHYMNEEDKGLLGKKRRKTQIILRNRDVISNGYAQIAPFKSEFFMQAPQKTFEESSVDWTDQLAIHEYRHLNQFINARRGIGWLVYWLFGDYGWGGLIGLTMPAWFIEGDATIAETALSNGGRGRVPSFSVEQRAQQEEGVQYSYMKALNGSFKDFVPNHYNTGYYILSEIRREADNEDFDEITARSSNFRGVIYPFRRAVRKVTGTSIKQHYFNSTAQLKSSIPESADQSSTPITSMKKKNVVQFKNPLQEGNELFFSYADRKDINAIYKYKEDGQHEKIVHRGLILDTYFDKYENYLVWEEVQRDIRRGNQNFSNLILYDIREKKKRIIGRNQAFRSPSFSTDGKNLVFVNGYLGTESGISMFNIESNALLEIIKSEKQQFLYPIQGEDPNAIYSIIKEGHYYAIAKITMQGVLELLTPLDDVVFGPLKYSDGHLIFQANTGNTDQIHALEIKTKQLKRISDDPIGMYNPSNFANGKLIVERPHSQGFLLHELPTDPSEWKSVDINRRANPAYYLETEHLEAENILEKVPNKIYEVSRYPRATKIYKPHSWLLLADGTEFSATLFSNNILNDVVIEPNYTYNTNVNGSFVGVDINYGRWFPVLQLGYDFAIPRVQTTNDGERSFLVSQHILSPGFAIPLNLTRGTYLSSLILRSSVSQIWTNVEEVQTEESIQQIGTTLGNSISFTSRRLAAVQNYYPRWGYTGTLRHRYRFNDKHNAFDIRNDFYVPGFMKNHGFLLEVDYSQQNEPEDTRVDHIDVFNYAAGFGPLNYNRAWSFNVNYGLPLFYPDWGFADFLYFKRVRTNVFHQFNQFEVNEEIVDRQAIGLDLVLDVVFNNTVFSELPLRFRFAYLIGELPQNKKYPISFGFFPDIPAF